MLPRHFYKTGPLDYRDLSLRRNDVDGRWSTGKDGRNEARAFAYVEVYLDDTLVGERSGPHGRAESGR